MMTLQDLIPSCDGVIVTRDRFRAYCPICRKPRRDFAAMTRKDSTLQLTCFCCNADRKELIEALGYRLSDLLPPYVSIPVA